MANNQLPEVPGAWERKPDRNGELPKGRLSTREMLERQAYDGLRQQFSAVLQMIAQRDNSLEELTKTLAQYESKILDLKRKLEIAHGKSSQQADQITALERQKTELMRIGHLWAQLALMMPDSEPKRVDDSFGRSIQLKTNQGGPSRRYTLRNKYGTFEFTFTYYGSCTLKVVPNERRAVYAQPFEMNISQVGLCADQVRQLTGTFGLSGQFVPEDTKSALHGDPQKAVAAKMLQMMGGLTEHELTLAEEASFLAEFMKGFGPRSAD